ncbi:Fungal specific transcription factor domain-containing protein 27 [Elsinoe fawcettii]|nr:Fungal specific transcription factor domain-containing protein 27 [Elsinoe fawcettii]
MASGRDCSYTTNPKKRGIQPGYIRTLESALALLFQRDIGAQRYLSAQLKSRGQLRQLAKDGAHSEDVHAVWTNSNVCKQIDAILSGSPSADIDNMVDGPEDDTLLQSALPPEAGAVGTSRGLPQDYNPGPSLQQPLSGGIVSGKALHTIELPTDFWSLIDHYNAYTHNWLPISEKNDVLKTAYSYPLQGPEASLETSGAHAELWAIVALSSRQTGASSLQTQEYAKIARGFIPDERGKFAKGHIRSLLLLCLLSTGDGDLTSAWYMVGFASRILLHLKLREGPAGEGKSRHLFMGCVLVDNIVSSLVDLPAHLSPANGVNVDKLDEDGLEEWSPWQPPAHFLNQTNGNASGREPGRSLSTFNALLDAFISIPAPQHQARTGRTPQQVHVCIMITWKAFKSGRLSSVEYQAQLVDFVERFGAVGGTASVPPSVIPLLREVPNQSLTTFSVTLLQNWTQTTHESVSPRGNSAVDHTRRISAATANTFERPMGVPPTPGIPNEHWAPNLSTMNTGIRRSVSFGQEHMQRQFADPRQNVFHGPSVVGTQQRNPYGTQPSMNLDDMSNNLGEMPNTNTTTNQDTPSGVSDGGGFNSEFEAIFEEMAQLDTARQLNDPQFMQNLGLGPDSDLRAFFGPDYQETDPLLAYLPFDTTGQPVVQSTGRMQTGGTYPT